MLFKSIHDLVLMLDHMRSGCEMVPTAGVVKTQSVQTLSGTGRGYDDVNKRVKGRTRHIVVDTDGRMLTMNLTPADVADSTNAQTVLDALKKQWPWVNHFFGDAAYDRRTLMDKAAFTEFITEIVRKVESPQEFVVQHQR